MRSGGLGEENLSGQVAIISRGLCFDATDVCASIRRFVFTLRVECAVSARGWGVENKWDYNFNIFRC